MWALRRQGLILSIIGIIVAGFMAWTYFALFYNPPSCFDRKLNQDEEGVDCGGGCAKLCAFTADAPSVTFVRAMPAGPGRTDVIAYVENPNLAAYARDARYTVELYGADNLVIAKKEGMVDLAPRLTPIFIPNFFTGEKAVARAFFTFDELSFDWYRYQDERPTLSIEDVVVERPDTLPRITATIENQTTDTLKNIPVVITVFDAGNTAIAASQTLVPEIRGQGEAPLVFTWNVPFSAPPARQEIIPVIPVQ